MSLLVRFCISKGLSGVNSGNGFIKSDGLQDQNMKEACSFYKSEQLKVFGICVTVKKESLVV